MKRVLTLAFSLIAFSLTGQTPHVSEATLLKQVLEDPSPSEIHSVLSARRSMDLSPKAVRIHDTLNLANGNKFYVVSHEVEGRRHFGAVVVPGNATREKLPAIVFATGGDGMHKEFHPMEDFNHKGAVFPSFMGKELDDKFVVVIPSFRGQQLVVGDQKYQSDGDVGDAFDGATTDALSFLNVVLTTFRSVDENRIVIYGGSRGGAVALLAASRDKRIKRAVTVAAPTDMKSLYLLYPDQFKLLFFNDLLNGRINTQEAKQKFIACSPVYFADQLPPTQMHHDKGDPFVPAAFIEKLTSKAKEKNIETHYYSENIHGFWEDEKFWKRVQRFMMPLVD